MQPSGAKTMTFRPKVLKFEQTELPRREGAPLKGKCIGDK